MKSRTLSSYRKALKEFQRTATTPHERMYRPEKQVMLKEAVEILSKMRSMILLDVTDLENRILKYYRARLESEGAVVRVFKNKIFIKAMRESELKNYEKLEKYFNKPMAVIASDKHNVFELANIINRLYSYTKFRAGEKAPFDIVIPAGPTDIPPGPMMSVFGRFKIPVQPREGRIHVIRDTVVVRQGQEIPLELVSLLDKLGITPVVVKPRIIVGYEDGVIFEPEQMKLELEKYLTSIKTAWLHSMNLAAETLVSKEPQVIRLSLLKAYNRSLALARVLGVVSRETISILILDAISNAYKLSLAIGLVRQEVQSQSESTEERKVEEGGKEEREREEGVSEETIAEGLSALFG
ncbi:MAG: 50S ribosomal protein L10 [Sulfolobales archaeon]